MEVWQEIAKNAECGAERLVAEYSDRLYAAASLLCRNNCDAEDLVFRTLARAVDKIRQFKPSGDFFSWLYKILLNFHRMDARRKRPDIVPVGSAQDLPQIPTEAGGDAGAELQEMVLLTLSVGIFGFSFRHPRSPGTITRPFGIIWLAGFLVYLILLIRQEAFAA